MALEYADSFDAYTTSQLARRYSSFYGTAINSPGPNGSGQYLLAISQANDRNFVYFSITPRSEYYAGWDFYSPSPSGAMIDFQTAGGISICKFTSGSAISTQFGNSSSGIMVANTWYQVQVYVKRHATAGIIIVKVDGTTVISLSGLNTGTSDIGQIMIAHGNFNASSNADRWANLWIFNTLGTHSNGFPTGRMKVQPLLPAADGTYTDWTPNSGSTHYTQVDEAQADDDTAYNSTVTAGNKDSYGIDAISGSPAQIHGVIVTAIARKTDVNSKNYQVFSKSGATETYSSDIAAALTYASSTANGADALLHTDDPNTSAQWAQTNLNAIEIGAKVTL
jgi:hypothetical protein